MSFDLDADREPTMRRAYVLGWPIQHSMSPAIQNAAFRACNVAARMDALAVEPAQLTARVAALRGSGCFGASVTLPHKQAVAELCDELAPAARAIGAVNCLAFQGDRVIGHNTDGDGFADALREAGVSLRGKRVALLGSGGAARAVAFGVREARAIEVIARRAHEVTWAITWPWNDETLLEVLSRSDLVVDCTSSGLSPESEAGVVDTLPLGALRPGAAVASLIYHRRPALLDRAQALGLGVLDGVGMLVHQGARAFEIWTGQAAPVEIMREALKARLAAP